MSTNVFALRLNPPKSVSYIRRVRSAPNEKAGGFLSYQTVKGSHPMKADNKISDKIGS